MIARRGQCDAATWGLSAPALGVLALVPTVILVGLLASLANKAFSAAAVLPLATVLAACFLGAAQVGLAWLLTTRAWPPRPALFGLRRPNMRWWRALLYCALTLAASLGGAQLYVMAVEALGIDALLPPELPPGLLLPGGFVIFTVIALAVVTPIAEEVFFRGFVQQGLCHRWGTAAGIIVSAAVFAVLHIQPAVIAPIFVTGLLLGMLYRRTGSVWPGIIVHGAQNLIATLSVLVVS